MISASLFVELLITITYASLHCGKTCINAAV